MMGNLIRRGPFREFYSMSRALDRLMDRSLGETGSEWDESMSFTLPLDVIEKEDEYLIKASVAGFDPDKIEVTFSDNTLTIKGEVKEEKETKEEGRYHMRELREGSFCRSVSMPGLIDPNKIAAETENGILMLHMPKKEEVKHKRIEIKPKNVKVIEGKK
jgi:HSP20 family protein